jgi:hypothetical protein
VFGGPATARSVATDHGLDVDQVPAAALSKVSRRHKQVVRETIHDANCDQWCEKTIYGIMDRSFLKPYHDQVMARLDELQTAARSLEKEADDAS